jgi:hypothetical protein
MEAILRVNRTLFIAMLLLSFTLPAISQEYVLVGWNDLGMHCSNKNFSKVVVLPPYNNVTAQLIVKMPGQSPRVVDSGYTIEYHIPNNTYSVGKTDFWTYAQQLFGLPNPLPPNIGLTGKGLTGTLDSSGSYFSAHGIPVTPFPDSDFANESPFQLIHLDAKSKADGSILTSTEVVIPVSNEVGCVQSGCHASETSILNSHESVSGFNRNGPVLCASCHASNALGTTGIREAGSFSFRMHDQHKNVAGSANAITTCYKCHPGPKTQCLRDIMGKNPTNPMVCQNCHGTMDSVARSISQGRRPWFDEPKCGTCHGSAYAEETGKLFRQSKGHGGLFCSACHGSPHAIQPTIQANDNLQNIRLQGFAGTLRKCSVCHATSPVGPGPHGIMDTVQTVPDAPLLAYPLNHGIGISISPAVQWNTSSGASTYNLQVATDSLFTTFIANDSSLTQTSQHLSGLIQAQTYYWRVQSVNQIGAGPWSVVWLFQTTDGLTFYCSVDKSWNLVSLPVIPDNVKVANVFPSSTSRLFSFNPDVGGYSIQDSLAPGAGYWLKFGGGETVGIRGAHIVTDTIDVKSGWNLVGSISDTVSAATIMSIPSGIIGSGFFGYNQRYQQQNMLIPSKGYWVKANTPGKIILNASSMAKAGTPVFSEVYSVSNKIVITDALGREQTLYIADQSASHIENSFFELPPTPPPGIFDVRFASNRFVELYAGDREYVYPLRISSAEYPVTIAWHLQPAERTILLNTETSQLTMASDGSTEILSPSASVTITVASVVPVPKEVVLRQNYPNPYNPLTRISFEIPSAANVKLSIYNLLGEEVAVLTDKRMSPGIYEAEWDASAFTSGMYFYRLVAGDFHQTKKMLLLK